MNDSMNNTFPGSSDEGINVPPMLFGGKIGKLVRETDWSSTALGDYGTWPQSLRSSLSLVLNSKNIAALYWGTEQWLLYNDAYSEALGDRHPWAFGRPIREALSDIAPVLGPQVEQVLATGQGFALENVQMTMCRYGKNEETFWTYSFSPIQGEAGEFSGVVLLATERTQQIYAERSASQARQRHQKSLDNMPGFMAIVNGPEHVVEYANKTYSEIVGKRDLVGLPLFDVFPEFAHSRLREILDKVYATGTSFSEDFMPFELNGEKESRYFNVHYEPVIDEGGHVTGIVLGGYEVTEQHRTTRALQALNADLDLRLKLADRMRPLVNPDEVIATACEFVGEHLDIARAVYVSVDESQVMLHIKHDWVNGTLRSLAGTVLKLDDFGPLISATLRAGQSLVIHDVATDDRSSQYADAYAAIGVRSCVAIPLIKAGKLRAILNIHNSRPHPWTQHDVTFAEDMLDRTWGAMEGARAQAELRMERDRSRAVFDTMTEGFAMLDCDWTILYMNAEGLRIGNRPNQQIIGQNHWDLWPEYVGSELEHLYRQVMQTRQPETIELKHTYADGTVAWLEVRAYLGVDDGLSIFFRDVTSRKEAEEKLRDADRRKDEFLAMLAHELRNPLAPIGAAAELLQMVKLDEARVHQTSQIIGRQVEHMTGLVNDLLDVSRVTSGKVELDRVPLDVNHILTDAMEQVSPLVGARKHRLMLDLPPNVVLITGDKKRLVQVVANLLTNAAKYTPENGTILLKTVVRDDHIYIEVTDNGIGMDADLVARAFDLFAQAERTSDRSSGGLGLGLALVRSLVELHSGTVTCASEGLGKGSTFTVCLPRLLERPNQADYLQDGEALQPTHQPLRVLVVDDNVDAAVMLTMLLEAAGHEVLVEHGAYRALERARADKPQVCLIDIGLPELDGNQVAQRLRSLPETANAVLIAVTGYGQESDRKSALAAGFNHHLVKPVDTRRLAAILSEIVVS